MTSEQPLVLLEHARKSFGGTPVLKDISLSVRRGEVVAVIGPSGGGKATLLRCCMPPDSSQGTLSSVPASPIFASRARACSMTSSFGRFCTCSGASVTFFSTV